MLPDIHRTVVKIQDPERAGKVIEVEVFFFPEFTRGSRDEMLSVKVTVTNMFRVFNEEQVSFDDLSEDTKQQVIKQCELSFPPL